MLNKITIFCFIYKNSLIGVKGRIQSRVVEKEDKKEYLMLNFQKGIFGGNMNKYQENLEKINY